MRHHFLQLTKYLSIVTDLELVQYLCLLLVATLQIDVDRFSSGPPQRLVLCDLQIRPQGRHFEG